MYTMLLGEVAYFFEFGRFTDYQMEKLGGAEVREAMKKLEEDQN